jgi:thiamine biosynthesis lipoprotein ApbE
VPVGALLAEALAVALRAAAQTDGDVDPTIGRSLQLAGYDRDWRMLAREGVDGPNGGTPSLRLRAAGGHRLVALDREHCTVMVPAGISLDLGATAKAWAADRIARTVHACCSSAVLVSLGGDIATAGRREHGVWRVHVTDDHRAGPQAPGQTIALRGGGLATSSTTVRRWRRADGDGEAHHIIDPHSGEPAAGPWRTVSVAAADCTDANVAATAALIRGERAVDWLRGLGLPARLVHADGGVLTVAGWPAQEHEHEVGVHGGGLR